MRVRTITRKNFMIPGPHRLDLPETGLVLITGNNGSGKSSWADAVSTAWNATLRRAGTRTRKAMGNLPGVAAKVEISTFDDLRITRNWSKADKVGLDWSAGHQDTSTTRAKSQKALDAHLGDYLVWRWSCVFSASPGQESFCAATATRRREILERLLDLDLLARGYKASHEATKAARRDLEEAQRAWAAAEAALVGLRSTLTASEQALASLVPPTDPPRPRRPQEPPEPQANSFQPPDPPNPPRGLVEPTPPDQQERDRTEAADRVRTARQHDETARSVYDSACRQVRKLELTVERLRLELEQAQERVNRLAVGECPTCGQEIPLGDRAAADAALETSRSRLSTMEADLQGARAVEVGSNDQLHKAGRDMGEAIRELEAIDAHNARLQEAVQRYRRERQTWSEAEERAWTEYRERLATYDDRVVQLLEEHNRQREAQDRAHKAHLASLEKEYRRAESAWETARSQAQAAHADQKARLDGLVSRAAQAVQEGDAQLTAAGEAVEEADHRYQLAKLGDQVLGPAGPRATHLAKALGRLESKTNEILNEIGCLDAGILQVKVVDEGKELGITIVSPGAPREYHDLSAGEARRIDLAVMRALGHQIRGARGETTEGTLWLDEFLDAVDLPSLDDVCAPVVRMAQSRCVVVITHKEDVVAKLTPRATKVVVMG